MYRCCCCCGMEGHHHQEHKHMHHAGFPWPIMDVEEYKEALTKRLEKVNKRLEALKR
ncbi:MAG: hypothetical protein QXX92_07830 [Candidatus Bathyarchaeia archaeon]